MKINEIIKKYIKKIPKDDIYLLISSFLNCNKLDVLKYLDSDVDYSKIEKLFKKYIKGEPINYILNSKEFYGLNFYVDNRVLIPRFETEILVEKVIERIEKLENKNIENFKVYLTIDGSENIYSKEIVEKYGRLKCIEFIGLQTRENLMKYYSKIETVIFPSKLETWGLPISEAKAFGKNIILADLEYAHETLGTYEKVMFFEPDNAEKLAEKIEMLINDDENMKNIEFDGNFEKNIEKPFCKNWKELFDILLLDNR